jgi:hypothetical protein
VCPITNTNRGIPFQVALPKARSVTGFVMVEQVQSIDFARALRPGRAQRRRLPSSFDHHDLRSAAGLRAALLRDGARRRPVAEIDPRGGRTAAGGAGAGDLVGRRRRSRLFALEGIPPPERHHGQRHDRRQGPRPDVGLAESSGPAASKRATSPGNDGTDGTSVSEPQRPG